VASTLSVKGWDRFQHYKDRDPPWVKLYRDLLTSESWLLGTDLSRLVQVASILLAARYQNAIPYRWDMLRKVTHLECTEKAFHEAVRHLHSTQFLEIHELTSDPISLVQDASAVLAPCLHDARTEERRGEESNTEERRGERASAAPALPGLDQAVWTRWLAYRQKIKKPIKPPSVEAAQKALAAFGADQAAVVEQSIAQGWQGLFALKRANGIHPADEQPTRTWRPSAEDDEEIPHVGR